MLNIFIVNSEKFLFRVTIFVNSQSTALNASSMSRLKIGLFCYLSSNLVSNHMFNRMLSPINLPFIKPVWSLSIIDGSTFLNLFAKAEAIITFNPRLTEPSAERQ